MKTFQSSFRQLSFLMAFVVLAVSCQKDEKPEAPELPPLSSLEMEFVDFVNPKSVNATESYQNRNLAVLHVAFWNTVVFVHMAVPVAAFREAFNHQPVLQGDGRWLWTYTVGVAQANYTARLYATAGGVFTQWEMYLSKTGPGAFTDFLWYSGQSHIGNTQGSWTLFKSPAEAVPFIDIDWYRNSNGTRGITYTNVVPGGPENGGFISHKITNDTPYDAAYEIYNKGQDNHVEIRWSRLTKAGQIKDPKFFGNEQFHCWDSTGADTDCP